MYVKHCKSVGLSFTHQMKCDRRSWMVELSNDNSAAKSMGSLVLYMVVLSCISHPIDSGQTA